MRGSSEERFWSKVDKTDGCWLWTASVSDDGYGWFRASGTSMHAHRFAYNLLVGPIPAGMELDHQQTCPKCCVNPAHLRVVSHKQNMENQRGAHRNSTSGFRGVSFHKRVKKWQARLQHYGRRIHGGYFSTAEEANEAAIALRRKFFTHSDMDVAKRNTTPRKGEMK